MTAICVPPLTTTTEIETLRRVWLFSCCSDTELREVRALCDRLSVPAGTTLARAGDDTVCCVAIVRGRATVTRSGRRIGHHADGDIVGIGPLIGTRTSPVTVVADTDLEILAIDPAELIDVVAHDRVWSVRHRLEVLRAEHEREVENVVNARYL